MSLPHVCSIYRPIGIGELIVRLSLTVIAEKGLTRFPFEMLTDSYLLLTLGAFFFLIEQEKSFSFRV